MIDFNNELERVVRTKVVKDPYPDPTPLIDDSEYRQEINDLKNNLIPRPSPKSEYLARLDYLQGKIDSIKIQNEDIKESNKSAKKAVDDKYISDLETAREDETNKWEALKSCADWHLNDTVWWMLPDSYLSEVQKTEAETWRVSMMSLKENYQEFDDALVEYNTLVDTKPNWELW